MQIANRTALVTGAAARIGRAIAEGLAARGCRPLIHCDHSVEAANQLADRLHAAHAIEPLVLPAHLHDQNSAEQLLDQAWQQAGPIEILVNNAAVFAKQDWWQMTESDLDRQLRTNFTAPLFLMRAFAARWKQAAATQPPPDLPAAKIVNLLDRRICGLDNTCVPYLWSKKMLADATRGAALEFAPLLTVNGVAPGPVLPPTGKGEDYFREPAGPIPLGTRPTPAQIADTTAFLLESDTITGQILFVDGGQHLLDTGA